jgi:predicted RNA-binding protein
MVINTWLAPVKSYSWEIILNNGVYGVPSNKRYELDKTQPNDFIVFYIYPPVQGIIGIFKIMTKPYLDSSILWSESYENKDKYDYRIKLELNMEYILNKKNTIQLYEVLGYNDIKKGYTIEPYLHNIILAKLSEDEFNLIIKKIKERKQQI